VKTVGKRYPDLSPSNSPLRNRRGDRGEGERINLIIRFPTTGFSLKDVTKSASTKKSTLDKSDNNNLNLEY
jgi:hypothetical protein